jgi:hypothetical protein
MNSFSLFGADEGTDNVTSEIDETTSNHTTNKREGPPQKRKKVEEAYDINTKQSDKPLSSFDQDDCKPAAVRAPTMHLPTLLTPSNVPLPRVDEKKYTQTTAFIARFAGETKVRLTSFHEKMACHL